jgi:hypothetical protein
MSIKPDEAQMVFDEGDADDFFFNDNCLLQDDLDMSMNKQTQRRLTLSAAKAK